MNIIYRTIVMVWTIFLNPCPTAYMSDTLANSRSFIYIYSQLSVSRTTDKSDFSISRTHLDGLVGFVSRSMFN